MAFWKWKGARTVFVIKEGRRTQAKPLLAQFFSLKSLCPYQASINSKIMDQKIVNIWISHSRIMKSSFRMLSELCWITVPRVDYICLAADTAVLNMFCLGLPWSPWKAVQRGSEEPPGGTEPSGAYQK